MARSKSLTKNLLALAIGCLAALILAEVVLRLYNPFGFRVKGDNIILPVGMKYVIENKEAYPGLDERIVHTKNSLGFRGPEPPPDLDGYLSILTVGGSTTECFYLSDGKTWPARLGRKLEESLGRVWLNNAGLDGHSTYGHLVLMADYLVGLRPKVVVFLVGVNEIGLDKPCPWDRSIKKDLMRGRLDLSSLSGLANSLAAHSETVSLGLNLYRYLRAERHAMKPPEKYLRKHRPHGPVPAEELTQVKKDQARFLAAYRDRLLGLIKLARQNNIKPVFITQPTLNSDQIWITLEAYNDVLRQVGRREKTLVIDAARKMANEREYYYDFVHFTNEGAQVLADIVFEELRPYLAAEFRSGPQAGRRRWAA
ncbi:MAG: SGNH/GDSL hydrolase family protein [Deltaproteobacteria bacterium]|nr:SGNH/GDSL hydrolase family protein [Deltaproteobacteria bacterium]